MHADLIDSLTDLNDSLDEDFGSFGNKLKKHANKLAKKFGNTAKRIKKRVMAGGKKFMRTHKTSTVDKLKAKKYRRQNRSQIKMHRKKVMKTSKFKRRQNLLAKLHGESVELDLRERMFALIEGRDTTVQKAANALAKQIGSTAKPRKNKYIVGVDMWEFNVDGNVESISDALKKITLPNGVSASAMKLSSSKVCVKVSKETDTDPLKFSQYD